MNRILLLILIAAFVLSGCAEPLSSTQKGAGYGALIGAASGALIGQARKRNPNANPGRVREILLELIEQS